MNYELGMIQMLANLYFNKVVLPQMEYVEDFVDFLIDAELNDLPVLKRACERYLCSELNTVGCIGKCTFLIVFQKKDITTCLLLDLLFNSIVFNLPVMKSMTLTELANRTHEFVDPEVMLEQDEFKWVLLRRRFLYSWFQKSRQENEESGGQELGGTDRAMRYVPGPKS